MHFSIRERSFLYDLPTKGVGAVPTFCVGVTSVEFKPECNTVECHCELGNEPGGLDKALKVAQIIS